MSSNPTTIYVRSCPSHFATNKDRCSAWTNGTCVYGAGRARPAIWRKRLSVMKDEGIIYSLLFPSRAMDIGTQRDKNFAVAFCRAYNDYIASALPRSRRA